MNPATQLHALLDAGQALSPTYGGGLSSHLPMAQQALLQLGAPAERLRAWSAHYAARLAARPAVTAARELGRPDSDAAWHAHFTARIAATGAEATLRDALPTLLDGAGGAAFHGLIRTGHAVLAGHAGELAAGLAHWAAHFLPLPTEADDPPLPLADWLAALGRLPPPGTLAGSSITGRMRAWGAAPGFAAVAGRLHQQPDTLRELALLAARSYAATANFTVLHLLTACHAMSVLAPEPPRGFIAAAAAGLLASGATPALTLDAAPGRPWPALTAAACAQDDAHVIKLTHAAWRLDQRWPDPAWRRAAERGLCSTAAHANP